MVLKLRGAYKEYIWGGDKLITEFGKSWRGSTLAESWELSFHPDGVSIVDGGAYDGMSIDKVAFRNMWGANALRFSTFPMLIKLIDSRQDLSVQVHPNDEFALANEGQNGKTEMWHILSAEADAKIYLGLKQTLTPRQFDERIANNTVLDCLNNVPVKAGQTYFIPSGTIHAIGAGVTLLEIQQNSSVTYRVYDYNRRDAQGNARPLHIDKAKQVVNLNKYEVKDSAQGSLLGKCKYFSCYLYCGSRNITNFGSFGSVTVVDGSIQINGVNFLKGQTAFIPAGEQTQVTGSGKYTYSCVE